MRWLIRFTVALLVLLALPIGALSLYLDEAVSRGATYALGVETRVRLVLRPIAGRVSVLRLQVDNPPGFESDRFLHLKRGRFDLRTRSLREDTIVSPLLRMEGVELSLEQRSGQYNYDVILDNLARFESVEETDPAAAEDAGSTRFVIRELEILNVVADVDAVELLGERGRIHVEIPEIRLRDVGGDAGVSMAELSNIVVKALLTAIAKNATGLPREFAGALLGGLGDLEGVTFDVGGQITSRAVHTGQVIVSGGAQSAVEDAARAVGEGAGKALRDLGGLLRRDEDD